MSIDEKAYDLLEKIINMDSNISFNLSNGLLGYGMNCQDHTVAMNTVIQFLEHQDFPEKEKYMNALKYGFLLSNK